MYFFWIDVFLLTSVLFPLYIDLIQRSDDEGNGPQSCLLLNLRFLIVLITTGNERYLIKLFILTVYGEFKESLH